jgi:chromosome segregation ATPase
MPWQTYIDDPDLYSYVRSLEAEVERLRAYEKEAIRLAFENERLRAELAESHEHEANAAEQHLALMDEIEHLRAEVQEWKSGKRLYHQGDEVERLREDNRTAGLDMRSLIDEVERLRAALEEIAHHPNRGTRNAEFARQALDGVPSWSRISDLVPIEETT